MSLYEMTRKFLFQQKRLWLFRKVILLRLERPVAGDMEIQRRVRGVEEWKSGRVEEGKLEEWKDGREEEWKSGRVEELSLTTEIWEI